MPAYTPVADAAAWVWCREREQGPRFVQQGSFEYDFGQKWKDVYTLYQEQQENLKHDLEENEAKLEMDMANAQLEHTASLLRQGGQQQSLEPATVSVGQRERTDRCRKNNESRNINVYRVFSRF